MANIIFFNNSRQTTLDLEKLTYHEATSRNIILSDSITFVHSNQQIVDALKLIEVDKEVVVIMGSIPVKGEELSSKDCLIDIKRYNSKVTVAWYSRNSPDLDTLEYIYVFIDRFEDERLKFRKGLEYEEKKGIYAEVLSESLNDFSIVECMLELSQAGTQKEICNIFDKHAAKTPTREH